MSVLPRGVSRPGTEQEPRESCPLCRAKRGPVWDALGMLVSFTPLLLLHQLSLPLPRVPIHSGPLMAILHVCIAVHSWIASRGASISSSEGVRTRILLCGSEDEAEAWSGVARGPLSGGVVFELPVT